MNIHRKPVWIEGVFLTQQHFQAWDHAMENECLLDRQTNNTWGVKEYIIDEAGLENSVCTIKKISILMADFRWLVFDSKASKDLLSINLEEEHEDIYLVIARGNDVIGVNGYPSKATEHCAWKAAYQTIDDELDLSRGSEVLLAYQNPRLSLQGDEHTNAIVIKLFELNKINVNTYVLSNEYIPPVLHMEILEAGLTFKQRIYYALKTTLLLIEQRRDDTGGEVDQFVFCSQIHFSLLRVVSRYYAMFDCFLRDENVTPFAFYLAMIQCSGELQVFSKEKSSHVIPYEHRALWPMFNTLSCRVIQLLKDALPEEKTTIALEKREGNLYVNETLSTSDFESLEWYLFIGFDSESRSWIKRFESQTKVGSAVQIPVIIAAASTGIQLRHISTEKKQWMKVNNGFYFELLREGECWESILNDKSISISLSKEFSSVNVELVIV